MTEQSKSQERRALAQKALDALDTGGGIGYVVPLARALLAAESEREKLEAALRKIAATAPWLKNRTWRKIAEDALSQATKREEAE